MPGNDADSPRSDLSDGMGSPSENYVQKMRDSVAGARKKGVEVAGQVRGVVGKLSRSMREGV